MNELTGGIRNALERGENIQKIKQSFVNAGYKPAEVEAASREAYADESQIQPKQEQPTKKGELPKPFLTNPPQKKSKTWLTITIIVSILIIIIAGLIGLFWDKIISLFK